MGTEIRPPRSPRAEPAGVAMWLLLAGALFAVIKLLAGCERAPEPWLERPRSVPTVRGYWISYWVPPTYRTQPSTVSTGWSEYRIHVTARPRICGAQVHIRLSDSTEVWWGGSWMIDGIGTVAETDSLGVFDERRQ